jgi:hypothetical protein
MKKTATALFLVIFGIQTLAGTASFAFGKKQTSADPISSILDEIQLNPYIMALQKEFDAAAKPTEQRGNETVITDSIQVGKRYECRVFYALSKNNPAAPAEARSWYEFSRFGRLFLDNKSYLDAGRIKTFAPNVMMENELWGQSAEKNYYEALRVNSHGDLIVQSFSPQMIWARALMNWLGIDEAINSWLGKNKGLALPTTIFGAAGFIVSFSYCPNPSTPNALFEFGSDQQVIDYIQSL